METLVNLKYDWCRNQIIYNSPAPLRQLATVKAAVSIWYKEEKWLVVDIDRVHKHLQGNIVPMMLPETIKIKVSEMVELIKNQLYDFLRFLPHECFKQNWWILFRDKISWTTQGTIDYKTSANALVDSVHLDKGTKFKIAAKFFLEDQINNLSIQMPRDYLEKNRNWVFYIVNLNGARIARKHFDIDFSFVDCMDCFKFMLRKGDNYGCCYYWQRLTEEEKLEVLHPSYEFRSFNELFIFTVYDKERRLQVLQDEEYCHDLLNNLQSLEWFEIFDSCVSDSLEFFSVNSLAGLFSNCVERIKSTIVYKKKYLHLCKLLLQSFHKQITTSNENSNRTVIIALDKLVEEGEVKFTKDFLQSASIEWIQKVFSNELLSESLAELLFIFLKCGIIESILTSVFSTVEERKTCFSTRLAGEFGDAISELISQKFQNKLLIHQHQRNDVDRLLCVLFSSSVDIKNYKNKFAEDRSVQFWTEILSSQNLKSAKEFVKWCFASEEEILHYLKNLFQSESLTTLLTCPRNLEKSNKPIVSLIKYCFERQYFINESIFHLCLTMLSRNSFYFYKKRNESKLLYRTLDTFLLACIQDDEKKLIDFRREFFTDKEKKLYISLPIEFLNQIHTGVWRNESWGIKDDLWGEMVDDFFEWICPSNESLNIKLQEELWDYYYAESYNRVCSLRKPIF